MEMGNIGQSNGGSVLGFISWILGVVCFTASQLDPADIRAWIVGILGGIASIMSIAINWKKFAALFKRKK